MAAWAHKGIGARRSLAQRHRAHSELRKWFNHDSKRWRVFRTKYFREIGSRPDVLAVLLDHVCKGPVTFVYAAREER